MRKSLALCLLVIAAAASNAFAVGEARLTGHITDAVTKQPIPGATVNVTALSGKTFNENFPVRKDGQYAVFLLDGTLKYKFTYSAPGYAPYVEEMKLKLGEPNIKDVTLSKGDGSTQGGKATQVVMEAKADPAVAAYNTGAQLANAGDDAGAIKKFQEAVAAKPELIAGWEALAKVQLRTKDYKGAIESANKAVAIDAGETDMYGVLYEAYNATGDKAKAAEAKKKLPANATGLFNDAAKLINAGKDGEAEPLLKQAITADGKFAQAEYELGMLYVRAGKNAEARDHLQKYLALEPNGKDAATAKEMLNYVK